MEKFANIKCPECGHVQRIEVPRGKCLASYMCDGCKSEILAKNECCVICEYSDERCPVSRK